MLPGSSKFFSKDNYRILLFLCNVFVLGLILLFSFINRLSSDDFYLAHLVNTKGIPGMVESIYHDFNGRWAGMILAGIFMFLHESGAGLIPFQLFTFFVFFGGLYLLVKLGFTFRKTADRFDQFNLTSLIFLLIFFTIPGKDEIFFWSASASQYTWSISFLMAGTWFLAGRKMIPAVICFFLHGGGPEVFSFVTLFLIIPGWFILQKKRKIKFSPFFFCFAAVSAGLILNILSEGNEVRADNLPEPEITKGIYFSLLTVRKHAGDLFSGSGIFLLLVAAISIFQVKPAVPLNKTLVLLVSAAAISIFIPAYLLSDVAPARTRLLAHLCFILTILVIYLSLPGSFQERIEKFRFAVPALYIILFPGIIIFKLAESEKYSRAFDQRMQILRSHSPEKTLILEPLPSSGWLHSAEITTSPDHFSNQHLKLYLDKKFDIILKEDTFETDASRRKIYYN